MGVTPSGTVTMHSDSESVTGQPSKAGKIAGTMGGGLVFPKPPTSDVMR